MSFTFFSCGRNNANSEYEQLIEYLDNENYSKAVSEIDNISENRNFLTEKAVISDTNNTTIEQSTELLTEEKALSVGQRYIENKPLAHMRLKYAAKASKVNNISVSTRNAVFIEENNLYECTYKGTFSAYDEYGSFEGYYKFNWVLEIPITNWENADLDKDISVIK